MRISLIFLCLIVLSGCLGVGARGGLSPAQVQALPPDVKDPYARFESRCSRCHTLARPLNANIADPEHWRRYVARMRRHPGSGISKADADVILKFLIHYSESKADVIAGGSE